MRRGRRGEDVLSRELTEGTLQVAMVKRSTPVGRAVKGGERRQVWDGVRTFEHEIARPEEAQVVEGRKQLSRGE